MSSKYVRNPVPMSYRTLAPKGSLRAKLSGIQRWICHLLTLGMQNKEIASHIGTSEQVVKNYCRALYDIVGVDTRLQLALAVKRDEMDFPNAPETIPVPEGPGLDPAFMRGKQFRSETDANKA